VRHPILATPIGRLRVVGMVEGVSFVLLLGVAMPLKYLADMPLAVSIAGWIHGVLFVALLVVLSIVRQAHGWTLWRSAMVVVAALLPFGPFVIDGSLRREDERSSG
jgi:integral membrane protein